MKQKDIIFILVPIVIFVIAWIVFNIYHSAARSTISEEQKTNLLPISPNFDTKTISEIKARRRVDPLYRISRETSIATGAGEIEKEIIQTAP